MTALKNKTDLALLRGLMAGVTFSVAALAGAQQPAAPAAESSPTKARAAAKKKVRPEPVAPRSAADANAAETRALVEQLRQEREKLEAARAATTRLIRLMVEEGVLPKDKAAQILPEEDRASIAEVTPKAKPAAPPPAPEAAATDAAPTGGEEATPRRKRGQTVRVPYVPEVVKDEIRQQIKQEVLAQAKAERWAEPGTLPEWLDRIAWEGDFRIRAQGDYFPAGNTDPVAYNFVTGANVENTRVDEHVLRLRLRLGMLAKVSDRFGVGLRIATGNINNPVTANQSMGRTGRPYELNLDRAYVRWDPRPGWSATAGRIINPWFWPTDLLWDEDLNFEGVAGSYRPQFGADASGFLTLGAFPLQYAAPTALAPSAEGKWLYGMQAGGEWRISPETRWTLAGALFDFDNIEGRPNTLGSQGNDWTAPQFRQKGNSVFDINFGLGQPQRLGLLSKFRVLNVSSELVLAQSEQVTIRVSGDYAKNIGYDRDEIRIRTGVDQAAETTAYQARLTLGRDAIRALHDWQVFVGYRYLERDAVLDAFTDSNFYRGGTNTKGYQLGLLYGFDQNSLVRVRWLSASEISGPPLSIDTLQADFSWRF